MDFIQLEVVKTVDSIRIPSDSITVDSSSARSILRSYDGESDSTAPLTCESMRVQLCICCSVNSVHKRGVFFARCSTSALCAIYHRCRGQI